MCLGRKRIREAVIVSNLNVIVQRFPDHEAIIRALYWKSLDFRLLCDDYVSAKNAFDCWRADERKAEEFRSLCRDIEEEVRELMLKAIAPSP
ncbi:hypothetical protein BLA27_10305 [Brucella cytisi]|uniref:HEPN domain-containing protein n=1 Tax=Brucella cytisi TaxID=407152 RepID=A0A1J6HML2_9HYPH|nr:hypothetical protein BLA27_10305 [Brucella cytisi]